MSDLSVKGINNRRFGTSVFLLAMNLAKFNELPEDLKAVMEANANESIATPIAKLWEEAEVKGEQAQILSGGEIVELEQAFFDAFDNEAGAIDEKWVSSFPLSEREKARQLLSIAKNNVRAFTP